MSLRQVSGVEVLIEGDKPRVLTTKGFGVSGLVVASEDADGPTWGRHEEDYRFGAMLAFYGMEYGLHVKGTSNREAAAYVSALMHATSWRVGLRVGPVVPIPEVGARGEACEVSYSQIVTVLSRWRPRARLDLEPRALRIRWGRIDAAVELSGHFLVVKSGEYLARSTIPRSVGIAASSVVGVLDGLAGVPDE